jgi:dolichol-phosphate mannosyltransferase
MKKIVVILPTYNERGNIESLIKKIQQKFKELNNYQAEILVVDDKSPDGTSQVVKKLTKRYRNIKLIIGEKRGLGNAYVRGMRYAINKLKADILFEMDADFSHDPNLLPVLVRRIEKGADFVIGSRYIKGGSIPKEWGIERKIFSIFGNLIARIGLMLLRIHDWTSGYRAIRKEVFKSIGNKLDKYTGYTFQIALLHRAVQNNFKVAEIPLKFVDRKYGKSKFIPTDYIVNTLLYILFNSSFIRFLIVGTIGFIIQTIIAKILINLMIHPGFSVAVGAEGAIISNFILNQLWTFSYKKIRGKRKIIKKFVGFNTVSLGAILIQSISVTIGTAFFGRDVWFIFMVGSIVFLVIPYSYLIYHKLIWKAENLAAPVDSRIL